MPSVPSNFASDVFINCPFDPAYEPLFNAIVFAVFDVGFRPRCSLETSNAGKIRIGKISDIIAECKYGIHDLSRVELDTLSDLPRFNMPLELGIDLGCKMFGKPHQREKVLLILDEKKYRYQAYISDIAGQDIRVHGNNEEAIIEQVRNWLRHELDPRLVIIPSGAKIFKRYTAFRSALPAICATMHWNIKKLEYPDFSFAVSYWIKQNPITL